MLAIQIYLIFFKSRNPHDSDSPKGTMYLYNCVYGNKKDKDKKRKEAQGAINTETVLQLEQLEKHIMYIFLFSHTSNHE